jgi:hypothetical protein
MIGDIVIIGSEHYVKTNSSGTLEKLPDIPWYRTLQIFFLNYLRKRSIGEVRDFYKRCKK